MINRWEALLAMVNHHELAGYGSSVFPVNPFCERCLSKEVSHSLIPPPAFIFSLSMLWKHGDNFQLDWSWCWVCLHACLLRSTSINQNEHFWLDHLQLITHSIVTMFPPGAGDIGPAPGLRFPKLRIDLVPAARYATVRASSKRSSRLRLWHTILQS